jgi:hypothetical protein
VDGHSASAALDDIDRRTRQTLRQGSPRRLPAWYTYGSAASLVLVAAGTDVTGLAAVSMMLAGLSAAIVLARALERVTGVRLRMRAIRWTPMAALMVAMVATLIAVGSLMRLLDLPAAGTAGGLAAALVAIAGMGRAQAASGSPRNPA